MQKVSAVLGSALFFVVAPFVLAGLIPWQMTGWEFRPAFLDLEVTRAIGVLLILIGLPGLVDSFARFALQGLGTPAPVAPTKNLVVTGLYRYVRNPIYVAVSQSSSVRPYCSAIGASFCWAHYSGWPSTCSSLPMKSRLCRVRLVQSTRHIAPTSSAGFRG